MALADDTQGSHASIADSRPTWWVWRIIRRLQLLVAGPDSPRWEDLRFPADGISIFGFGSDPSRDTVDGLLEFDPDSTERVFVTAQMPHGWKEGSEISPHVHWSPTDTDTGNVLWRLEYQMANIDGTFPGTWTALDILDAGDGTADKHQIAEWAAIDMAGMEMSCIIKFKISRIGGGPSDTYTADAKMLEFDIHYQIDSAGSRQEYVK